MEAPTCSWEDEVGNPQDTPQREGVEQGDSLMPPLVHVGTGPSTEYCPSKVGRQREGLRLLGRCPCDMRERPPTQIRMHHGKTQVWNRGGVAFVSMSSC